MAHEFTPLQRAWIDRLRSGKDPQTQGLLTEVNVDGEIVGHCCLGLGCVVMAETGAAVSHHKEFFNGRHRRTYTGLSGEGSGTSLQGGLRVPLGLRHPEGYIPSLTDRDDESCALTALNDGGLTFPQIADVVEYFADELFEPTLAAA